MPSLMVVRVLLYLPARQPVCMPACLQDALGVITDADASISDKEAALSRLQELVEPIDNANGALLAPETQQHTQWR